LVENPALGFSVDLKVSPGLMFLGEWCWNI